MVNLIPEIIREQNPPRAQASRQKKNQANRIRRFNAEFRNMRVLFQDDDDNDDVLPEIIISDDDDDDDLDNPQGSDRRHSRIINRPEQQFRPGQPIRPRQLIRPAQPIRPFPWTIKQEPTDQSVVQPAAPNVFGEHVIGNGAAVPDDPDRGVGEDIDNLLDRQMARARQRLQQQGQKKSSIQKKRSLNVDSEGSSQQKRRAIPLRGNNVKDSKPGFQV